MKRKLFWSVPFMFFCSMSSAGEIGSGKDAPDSAPVAAPVESDSGWQDYLDALTEFFVDAEE